jgi:hypothetical protein
MHTQKKKKRVHLIDNLKPEHVRERYQFAKDHIHWTIADWKRVMFSDESMVSRVGSCGRKFYYSDHEHKRLQPHQVRRMQRGGGGKMMIWGCITFFGHGDLCRINGTLGSDLYLDILRDYVIGSFKWYKIDPATSIFQQDNARVHTAASVQEWFSEQVFTVLKWPPNSPDLNIIEHVWSDLKRRLDQYEQDPKTMDELWEHIQDVWNSTSRSYLQELYKSLPQRMKKLLRSKGGHID